MKYQIIYNGEIIDTVYDVQLASNLLKQYRVDFKSNKVYIRVVYC